MRLRDVGVMVAVMGLALATTVAYASETEPNDSCVAADAASPSETGTLGPPDVQDWWFVTATYGQNLTVQMDPSAATSNFDLELYDPDCKFRAGVYGSGGETEATSDVADKPGRYHARVIYNSGPAGAYTLEFIASANESSCSDSALASAGAREGDLSDVSCLLPPMGNIFVRIVITVSTDPVPGSNPPMPGGVVQGGVSESGIQCGPEIGRCTASAIDFGGHGRSCRALALTAGVAVSVQCRAFPAL